VCATPNKRERKKEVWERGISVIGCATTAFRCIQWHLTTDCGSCVGGYERKSAALLQDRDVLMTWVYWGEHCGRVMMLRRMDIKVVLLRRRMNGWMLLAIGHAALLSTSFQVSSQRSSLYTVFQKNMTSFLMISWIKTVRLVVSIIGGRAFPVSTSQIWNSLPETVVSASTLRSFQHQLKPFYFNDPLYISTVID